MKMNGDRPSGLAALFKDTAIYGMSSIIGRFLNYLLVPLYTLSLPAQNGGYGVVTNIYAWVALCLVLLTFGMETGFFYFTNDRNLNPEKVYSTSLIGVGGVSLTFLALGLCFLNSLSALLGYAEHPWYVGMMMIVVAQDAVQSIPFAYFRYKKKPLVFVFYKLLFIFLNIFLNLIYFLWMDGKDVGKAFLMNLVCTSIISILMVPYLKELRNGFDAGLFRRMLLYSLPLLVLGIAGILNQVADKIIFSFVYPDRQEGLVELGIYGASVKVAMIMAILTQAFRYAYEPFVFSKKNDQDCKTTYAKATKYFVIFSLLAFLAVVFYLDILKYIIGKDYREGLKVVPIVMMAEIFMGIYFNLSFWYKLNEQTYWGAIFSTIGCIILVIINILFIPKFSYMACAWAGVAGYGIPMLLSYFVGQSINRIEYDVRSILRYFFLALGLYGISLAISWDSVAIKLLFNTVLISIFIAHIIRNDFPISGLPLIGRYFK